MKQSIFLLPALLGMVIVLASCGSDSSGDLPDREAGSVQAREDSPSGGRSEPNLGSLGFQTPKEDLQAIDFNLKDLTGRPSSLSAYKGKVVLLNFWATWCGPCRAEIPSMEQLYTELKDEGFTIVAVNSQEPLEQVSAFVDDMGMSFPVLLDSTGRVGAAYGVRAIPTTYIIDPQGAIRGRMVGTRDWYSPEIISAARELCR
jgi:DsbE subfamily thiol:disulfide oxidoreductase